MPSSYTDMSSVGEGGASLALRMWSKARIRSLWVQVADQLVRSVLSVAEIQGAGRQRVYGPSPQRRRTGRPQGSPLQGRDRGPTRFTCSCQRRPARKPLIGGIRSASMLADQIAGWIPACAGRTGPGVTRRSQRGAGPSCRGVFTLAPFRVGPCLPVPHLMRGHGVQTSIFGRDGDVILGSDAERPGSRTGVELRPTSFRARTWLLWAPCQARGDDRLRRCDWRGLL